MNLDPVALRWNGWGWGGTTHVAFLPTSPSTCRTSVVSITSLPPNSPRVPDPYGPSFLYTPCFQGSAPPHQREEPIQWLHHARTGHAALPARRAWTWTVLRAGGRAVGHAEPLDAQFTLDTYHMWKKSQGSPSSPTD